MAEVQGNCAGLVTATIAVADNVNALRETLICFGQLFEASFPPASYAVERDQLLIRALAKQTEALCQVIQQVGFLISRTDAEALPEISFEEPVLADVQLHPECTSQYYCPPGYIRNEQGLCVPIA